MFESNFKGIALTVAIGIVAILLSKFVSIGSVALAIILGVILANSVNLHNSFAPGITYSEKKILAFAIATMGINLNFSILMQLGAKTITLIILSMILLKSWNTIFSINGSLKHSSYAKALVYTQNASYHNDTTYHPR